MSIVSDDQGIWALGCYGNGEIRTPNLDRLASRGIRFDNFFCASPVCSPARASLMTGRIPSQHGIHDWIREGNSRADAIDYLAGQRLYTDRLAACGYACGFSGKWHLGDSATPRDGFTHWYVHERGGGPYYNAPMYRDGERVLEPGYITDVITDDALDWIDRAARSDGPFYAAVHYTAPHSPWIDNHPKAIVDSYDDCPFASCPDDPPHPWFLGSTVPGGVREQRRENLKGYFAAVTAMDANIGRILDKLDALNITKDTLVFFISDNGYNCGHHGVWGKGNGTFPLNMYDSSVKVPTIIAHPGAIPAGTACAALLSQYDFMPTLLDYLGIEHPDADTLPGRSFASLLRGEAVNEREEVVVYDEYGPVRMIRSREWKYVHRYPYGPHELYDLVSDPDERNNVFEERSTAALRAEMKARLEAWFARYVAPDRDGVREAVYGKGQLRLAGPAGRGEKAFADDV
ncbi:MAG TPA: sulfatase-like hydrolase/transferase [Candidatus Hydrogenedentes bacterium]|nr:sulfatase-like hydrolase/transferase [Candidatus Hydrogenedentota bacterium]